jgi:chemotaxis protein methyltransferase CheR
MRLEAGDFEKLRAIVHDLCGLALTPDKDYLLRHRLGPVARAADCTNFAQFIGKLASPRGASYRESIIEAITTRETSFFRDGHPFVAFRQSVLPELTALRRPSAGSPIRIWCAGVSTGQEAYSVAMAIDDYVAANPKGAWRSERFGILATDVSTRALEAARLGRYSDREVNRGLTAAQRDRCFNPDGNGWLIDDGLKQRVQFTRINLIEPFHSVGLVDVIFCRNVLIYFDDPTRRRICDGFAEILRPGGYLFLGEVENLYGVSTHFVSERIGRTLVYRRA